MRVPQGLIRGNGRASHNLSTRSPVPPHNSQRRKGERGSQLPGSRHPGLQTHSLCSGSAALSRKVTGLFEILVLKTSIIMWIVIHIHDHHVWGLMKRKQSVSILLALNDGKICGCHGCQSWQRKLVIIEQISGGNSWHYLTNDSKDWQGRIDRERKSGMTCNKGGSGTEIPNVMIDCNHVVDAFQHMLKARHWAVSNVKTLSHCMYNRGFRKAQQVISS